MDGKIATKTGDSKWITCDESRKEVYKMREEFSCILTSSNTVIADNPMMEHKFKCILDKDNRTSKDAKIPVSREIPCAGPAVKAKNWAISTRIIVRSQPIRRHHQAFSAMCSFLRRAVSIQSPRQEKSLQEAKKQPGICLKIPKAGQRLTKDLKQLLIYN